MKQKLRKRNQAWISRQLQQGMPLSFFINLPSIRAAASNGERLKRRGRLKPDWNRALFHQVGEKCRLLGQEAWFEGFDKEQLPRELIPLWEDA